MLYIGLATALLLGLLLYLLVRAAQKETPWYETIKSRYGRRQYLKQLTRGMGWQERHRFLNGLAADRRARAESKKQ